MTTLTLQITRTAKTADVKDADMYLRDMTACDNYDIDVLKDQESSTGARDRVNEVGTFKCYNYPSLSKKSNLLVQEVTYTVPDVSVLPGITVENALEVFIAKIKEDFQSAGLGEYMAWKQQYYADNFDQTFTATLS